MFSRGANTAARYLNFMHNCYLASNTMLLKGGVGVFVFTVFGHFSVFALKISGFSIWFFDDFHFLAFDFRCLVIRKALFRFRLFACLLVKSNL